MSAGIKLQLPNADTCWLGNGGSFCDAHNLPGGCHAKSHEARPDILVAQRRSDVILLRPFPSETSADLAETVNMVCCGPWIIACGWALHCLL